MRLVVSLKEVLVIPQSFILNYTVISPYTSAKLVFFNWLLAINWFSAITVQPSTTYILCHKFSYKIHWNICHFICINLLSIRLNWFYRIFNLKLFLKFVYVNYRLSILYFYCFARDGHCHIHDVKLYSIWVIFNNFYRSSLLSNMYESLINYINYINWNYIINNLIQEMFLLNVLNLTQI